MDALTDDDFQAFGQMAAAAGRAMCPAVVEIGGEEYAATVPAPRRGSALLGAGTADQGEVVVRISKEDLATAPDEHTTLRWKRAGGAWSAYYRIDEVAQSPLDTEWNLTCIPAN
jgi:hypothetical protein